mmetsp:Transcript_40742/g.59851  ORF Transcript_40742/g.59851 Transcript_40742/m.59851 type:complete len:248 (-) Transcript_40742:58-801(-)
MVLFDVLEDGHRASHVEADLVGSGGAAAGGAVVVVLLPEAPERLLELLLLHHGVTEGRQPSTPRLCVWGGKRPVFAARQLEGEGVCARGGHLELGARADGAHSARHRVALFDEHLQHRAVQLEVPGLPLAEPAALLVQDAGVLLVVGGRGEGIQALLHLVSARELALVLLLEVRDELELVGSVRDAVLEVLQHFGHVVHHLRRISLVELLQPGGEHRIVRAHGGRRTSKHERAKDTRTAAAVWRRRC